MPARLRSRLTFANVASSIALFLSLSTGAVYAANEWTGANIVNASLTNADLAPNTIASNRILNETVAAVDLAPDSVGSSEIALGAVHASEIAGNSVDSGRIIDHSVGSSDLGNGSVGQAQIQTDGVGSAEIDASAVGSSEIATDAVGPFEIADNAIDSGEIATNSVTLADIRGANVNGTITVGAGIANGSCVHLNVNVPGAATDEVVVISTRATPPVGMVFYGVRVPADGTVTVAVCNFTGENSPAINQLPVHLMTIS